MDAKVKGIGQIRRNGPNGVADIGLSLMSSMSVFATHSALAPSYATFRSFFSRTPEERAIARETLFLSLGASTVASLGILLVFGRWIPAVVAQATGVGLFAIGMYASHAEPPPVSTMKEKREEQMKTQAPEIPSLTGFGSIRGLMVIPERRFQSRVS